MFEKNSANLTHIFKQAVEMPERILIFNFCDLILLVAWTLTLTTLWQAIFMRSVKSQATLENFNCYLSVISANIFTYALRAYVLNSVSSKQTVLKILARKPAEIVQYM